MWRGALLTVVATATVFACSGAYKEDVPPGSDAGTDGATTSDAAIAPVLDATTSSDGSVTNDASPDSSDGGSDATIDAPPPNPCDAGYEPGPPGTGCQLANPFLNPSFQTNLAWTATRGATVLPTTAGPDDVGVARLTKGGSPYGQVKQTITLPPSFADLPLAFTAVYDVTANGSFVGYLPVGMTSDGKPLYDWQFGLRAGGRASARICLGEAVLLGGPHEIGFEGIEYGYTRVDLDRVGLELWASCPPRGIVRDGAFDTPSSWRTNHSSKIENGQLHFVVQTVSPAHAFQAVSIPSVSMASPALKLTAVGAGKYYVELDGVVIAARQATPTAVPTSICLPAWSRGLVVELLLGSGGNGNINDALDIGKELTIDDVSLVDDPNCALPSFLENRDFENPSASIPGWLVNAGEGYSAGLGGGVAHGGKGYLSLGSNPKSCSDSPGSEAEMRQSFLIPDHDPAVTGPRVSFWYRYHDGGSSSVSTGLLAAKIVPGDKDLWTKATACISGEPPGARYQLNFRLTANVAGCTTSTFDVDDVVVELDPECKD